MFPKGILSYLNFPEDQYQMYKSTVINVLLILLTENELQNSLQAILPIYIRTIHTHKGKQLVRM